MDTERTDTGKGMSLEELLARVEVHPDSIEANQAIAKYYQARGEEDKARPYLVRVLELSPEFAEGQAQLGAVYFSEGCLEEAEAKFKRALELDPSLVEVHFNLGMLYKEQRRYAEAAVEFREVVLAEPEDAEACMRLGECCVEVGMVREAEEFFTEATRLEPEGLDGWLSLGKMYQDRGELEKAVSAFERCLEIDAGLSEVHERLRQCGVLFGSAAGATRLRVGFVTIWFERGQAYVTKILRDVIARDHETFIFARTGGVYRQPKLETKGFWDVPNRTTYPQYQIPPDVLTRWIQDNRLDVVIFNEEYDWNLVQAAKATGAKVLTYLDFYKEGWKPFMGLYDAVLCSTLRTFHLVKDWCNAYYVGWAVDADLFRPRDDWDEKFTFFHNAGWLGINYRKMTPAVILAFDAISRHLPDVSLFVHAQAEMEKLPPEVARIVRKNPRITYHVETVPAPGLYHKGRILVFPSKLEGLGLPLLEGMACGLPAIATDAPPMNEFVRDGENGLLVRVAQTVIRQDHIAFPETIVDVNDLAAKMSTLAQDTEEIERMSVNARKFAEEGLALHALGLRVNHLFTGLFDQDNSGCSEGTPLKSHIGCGNVTRKGT